jgi:hypothetical protein
VCVCVCVCVCARACVRAHTLDFKDFKTFVIVRKLLQFLILCGGNKLLVIIIVCVCLCGPQRLTASVKYHMGKWHLT